MICVSKATSFAAHLQSLWSALQQKPIRIVMHMITCGEGMAESCRDCPPSVHLSMLRISAACLNTH